MNQQRNNKIVMVALGVLLLLASLPSEWMTMRNAVLNLPGALSGFGSGFGGLTLRVTGLSGSITFGAKLPIWLIVSFGILSLLLISLNQFHVTRLPTAVVLGPGVVSAAFTALAVLMGLFSKDTSLGFGGFLALAGLGLGWLAHSGRINRVVETDASSSDGPGAPSTGSGV